ncbi:MAG: PGPGW domain-containing protein [Hyphococcus sp.]
MLPVVHQVLGSTLVVAGLVVLPLPIPFGLIMLTIGFALLAPYIPAVQRLIRKMRTKWPKLDFQLRRYRNRFPAVIRKTIDKTHPTATAE